MNKMIATWRMAKEGIEHGCAMMKQGATSSQAIEQAIVEVEDFPYFKSVGYGGLPNENREVELDAAFMDGDTFSVGAVAALKDIANPIKVARRLSEESLNCILVGEGAKKYATQAGFEVKEMLTDRAIAFYNKRLQEQEKTAAFYRGHDTVGMVALDAQGKLCVATSTSGLFMKKAGRVGDSPLIGSGFYADSEIGGATATGCGEDLMKGCISYEIVQLMKTHTPQEACEIAVRQLDKKLREKRGEVGDLSVVAMNRQGEWGAASNITTFSVVVCDDTFNENGTTEAQVYLVGQLHDGHCELSKASQEWSEEYMRVRMAEVK